MLGLYEQQISSKQKPILALTLREKQCMEYLLKGFTMKEVGKIMNITHQTVETHVANMKNKLGFSNTKKMIFYIHNTMNQNHLSE